MSYLGIGFWLSIISITALTCTLFFEKGRKFLKQFEAYEDEIDDIENPRNINVFLEAVGLLLLMHITTSLVMFILMTLAYPLFIPLIIIVYKKYNNLKTKQNENN